jgi:glycine oxidase
LNKNTDIIIVGGGILGLLTTRELVQRGMTATVIEQGFLGKESSWAGGGILLPLYPWRQQPAISQLVLQSIGMYPQLAAQLLEATGIDPEWRPCGLLITRNPDFAAARAWCNRNLIEYQDAPVHLLNGLNTEAMHPVFLPGIAQIRNPWLIKALKQDLLQKGVRLLENCRVSAVELQAGKIHSIETNLGKFSVHQLIVTAGAWSAEFFERFFPAMCANKPEIAPVKGQMLLYAADPELLKTIVLEGDHYLIPRKDGHILAGSTVEAGGQFDKTVTDDGRMELDDFAKRLLPALQAYPLVNHWAGIRPGTSDGVPYIDSHPEISNLSINAGHFRNGLAMAPASAKLIADLILQQAPSVDPEPYRLTRLA